MRYLLSGALCLVALPCLAAPGEIARAPVTEATGVQPNILFILDDSGSMAWEDTLNKGVEHWGYQPASSVLGNSGVYSINAGVVSHRTQNTIARAIGSCNGFNVLAYDPELTYTPWAGKDRFGVEYADATLLTARSNPYEPTSTVNLTGVYYMPWTDNDGDGEYDFEECGLYQSGSSLYVDNTRQTYINQQSAAQKTNFANWFTYYRDRMSVAKSAMAGVIDANESRVGLRTIQGRNNRNVADMTDVDEREDLLEELFTAYPSGGTPLRTSLKNVLQHWKQCSHSECG